MTGAEWLVIVGGITAILWVNWYFFLSRPASAGRKSEKEGK